VPRARRTDTPPPRRRSARYLRHSHIAGPGARPVPGAPIV
jgi:hypothetical protein